MEGVYLFFLTWFKHRSGNLTGPVSLPARRVWNRRITPETVESPQAQSHLHILLPHPIALRRHPPPEHNPPCSTLSLPFLPDQLVTTMGLLVRACHGAGALLLWSHPLPYVARLDSSRSKRLARKLTACALKE